MKLTFRTRESSISRAPRGSGPVKTLTAPEGTMPATISAHRRLDNGVNGLGLTITVLPARRAGPSFIETLLTG